MPNLAMDNQKTRISKFLSFVLRHRPDEIGVELDTQGWVAIDALLAAAGNHGTRITREELDDVVKNNNKQRFAISEDGTRIRASQGHSTDVELGYAPSSPPDILFHGTATRNLASIRAEGLLKGKRHHVHLSSDSATATQVGSRHGNPVVLIVRAGDMPAAGHEFFLSANGVWLTEHVPATFIDFGPAGTSVAG
jgi:putative RNA 2'-phosphotransferase